MKAQTFQHIEQIEERHGTMRAAILAYLVERLGKYDGIGGLMRDPYIPTNDNILQASWVRNNSKLLFIFCTTYIEIDYQNKEEKTWLQYGAPNWWTFRVHSRVHRYDYTDPSFTDALDDVLDQYEQQNLEIRHPTNHGSIPITTNARG